MNMGKNEVMTLIAAILSSLHETDSGCPESMGYMLCGMDLDKWNYIRGIMLRGEWITCKSNYINLTPAGTKMAIQIDNAMKASK